MVFKFAKKNHRIKKNDDIGRDFMWRFGDIKPMSK